MNHSDKWTKTRVPHLKRLDEEAHQVAQPVRYGPRNANYGAAGVSIAMTACDFLASAWPMSKAPRELEADRLILSFGKRTN
jgi:hypothetical protein